MQCPKCLYHYDDNSKFCPSCGEVNPGQVQQSEITPSPPTASTHLQPLEKKKGGFKKFWSGLPILGKVALIAGVIVILVVVVAVSISESKHETSSPVTSNTSTETSNTQFEQIGAYNPGTFKAGLEADSYYVSNPTKSAIRKFCEQQKSERLSDLKYYDRNLVISFYDDRDHTPNYTDGYDPSDTSFDQYRIADYVINPTGGGTDEVNFSKEIPE